MALLRTTSSIKNNSLSPVHPNGGTIRQKRSFEISASSVEAVAVSALLPCSKFGNILQASFPTYGCSCHWKLTFIYHN